MDLSALLKLLVDNERVIAGPVTLVEDSSLDVAVESGADGMVCRFSSPVGRSCPFELVFGRGDYSGRFSFFVGAGAEFCNFERIDSDDAAAELRDDLLNFLSCRVVSIEWLMRDGQVGKVEYALEGIGRQSTTKLTFRPRLLLPFVHYRERRKKYEPWLQRSS